MLLLVDLSDSGKLVLTGPDRARFLHGMVTNDVTGLAPGRGCHAAMLTVKGKLLGDLRIYCRDHSLLVEMDVAATTKIREALEKHLIMDEVEIADRSRDLAEVALLGGGARVAVEALLGAPLPDLPPEGVHESGELIVCATRLLGEAGFRVFGPPARLAAIAGPRLTDEERERRRVEAGEPRYGVDMGEDHLPIESRLDDAISMTKGCYLGQEVIVRATQQGRINRRLMGLRLDGDAPAERGAKLSAPSRPEAGTLTSSVHSPRLGAIALGYVHRTVWEPGTVLTLGEGAGRRRAVVTDLPFSSPPNP